MKRRIAAAVTAAIFVFGASGCTVPTSDNSQPTETVTVAPSESAPESQAEEVFPDVIRDNTDSFDQETDESINGLARTMCDAWEDGATFGDLAGIMLETGFSPREAGFFIGAGTAAFCPQFSSEINSNASL